MFVLCTLDQCQHYAIKKLCLLNSSPPNYHCIACERPSNTSTCVMLVLGIHTYLCILRTSPEQRTLVTQRLPPFHQPADMNSSTHLKGSGPAMSLYTTYLDMFQRRLKKGQAEPPSDAAGNVSFAGTATCSASHDVFPSASARHKPPIGDVSSPSPHLMLSRQPRRLVGISTAVLVAKPLNRQLRTIYLK